MFTIPRDQILDLEFRSQGVSICCALKELAWTKRVRQESRTNVELYSITTISGTSFSVELERLRDSLKVTVIGGVVELTCSWYTNVFYNIVSHVQTAISNHERQVSDMRKAANECVLQCAYEGPKCNTPDPDFHGYVSAYLFPGSQLRFFHDYELDELYERNSIAKSLDFVAKHSVGDEIYY